MSDQRNIPVPDELAAVREQIKALEQREGELKQLILANPDIRTGASWAVEVKTTKRKRTDLKELRANYPEIVAEFTFRIDVTEVVLLGITEDGELISARAARSIETTE